MESKKKSSKRALVSCQEQGEEQDSDTLVENGDDNTCCVWGKKCVFLLEKRPRTLYTCKHCGGSYHHLCSDRHAASESSVRNWCGRCDPLAEAKHGSDGSGSDVARGRGKRQRSHNTNVPSPSVILPTKRKPTVATMAAHAAATRPAKVPRDSVRALVEEHESNGEGPIQVRK
jgi:hypothetical protein